MWVKFKKVEANLIYLFGISVYTAYSNYLLIYIYFYIYNKDDYTVYK